MGLISRVSSRTYRNPFSKTHFSKTPNATITMTTEQPPRRIRPGTRYKDFHNYPKNSYEGHREQVMGVAQWIEQNSREFATSEPEKTISPPEVGNHSPTDDEIALWKYEQVRYFCKELNWLVVAIQGFCPPLKYPQMIATEQWIFLCAAHKTPKECPAVDYMRHTLDFVAVQLNDPKRYPSRTTVKDQSVQKLGNICRRIYRLFAHAYYQHRSIYDEFERNTKLCTRFTMFVRQYDMMPDSNIIVPCEGAPKKAREIEEEEIRARKEKRDAHNKAQQDEANNKQEQEDEEEEELARDGKENGDFGDSDEKNWGGEDGIRDDIGGARGGVKEADGEKINENVENPDETGEKSDVDIAEIKLETKNDEDSSSDVTTILKNESSTGS